jgi:hypothetical protein
MALFVGWSHGMRSQSDCMWACAKAWSQRIRAEKCPCLRGRRSMMAGRYTWLTALEAARNISSTSNTRAM